MSNRIYIPPRKDPRLPLVQPGGVIRPKGAGGAGPSGPYVQNLIDAGAPAWLHKNSPVVDQIASAFTCSFWYTPRAGDGSTGFGFEFGNSGNSGRIYWAINRSTGSHTVIVQTEAGGIVTNRTGNLGGLVDGTRYHFLITASLGSGNNHIYQNEVPVPLSGTDTGNPWPDVSTFNRNSFFSNKDQTAKNGWQEIADIWFDQTALDITQESIRRLFSDEFFDPIRLGANGENPTGGKPLVFYGEDNVAADWNAGNNLGGGGAFDDGAAGWDTFTDV